MVGNSWFKKKDVYKYTWLRMSEGGVVERGIDGLFVVTKTNPWKTVDEKVRRGECGGMSDHILVEAWLKLMG